MAAGDLPFGSSFTFALPALQGSVTLSGTPKIGVTLSANASITSSDYGTLTYAWYRVTDGAEGAEQTEELIADASGATYTPSTADDVGKKITVKVSAANYSGEKTATTSSAVAKADGPAPEYPGADDFSVYADQIYITLHTSTTQRYTVSETTIDAESAESCNWQTPIKDGFQILFDNLKANTTYYVYVQKLETPTHNAGSIGTNNTITTLKASAPQVTAPVATTVTDTTITVTAADGQKYAIKKDVEGVTAPDADSPDWKSATGGEVEFTGLTRNTAYKVYTFIPEGTNTEASGVVSTDVTTKETTITELMFTVNTTAKTYSTEAQEPSITTSLTKDTDYTVSYAVKEGSAGSLKDNKPCGAGTYVVTVAGTGDYQDSFTKEFTINKKTVTITPNSDQSKTYGASDPDLAYTTDLTGALATAFDTAKSGALSRATGEYAGEYDITIGTLAAGDNFELQLSSTTVKFKINPKDVAATRDAVSQTVVKGVGEFTQPTFADEDGLTLTGALTYSYAGKTAYADVKTALAALAAGATGTINYSFVADGNYTGTITGSISFTVVDIEFKVGEAAPTAENAINTLVDATTYGKTWSERISVKSDAITAKVGDTTITGGTYTIVPATGNLGDRPGVGTQNYTVKFTGGTYTNVDVFTGSISVTTKPITITGVTATEREYEKDTTTVTLSGGTLSGVETGDTVDFTLGSGTIENANAGTKAVTTSITLTGDDKDNYSLTQPSINVTIRPKTVDLDITVAAGSTYNGEQKTPAVTVKLKDTSTELALNADYTVAYENNINAGSTAKVKVTAVNGSNYTWTGAKEQTFTIAKATYAGETALTGSAKYGTVGAVNLNSKVVIGGTASYGSITSGSDILDGVPSVSDNTLSFKFQNDSTKVDDTAVIKVKVESNNYADYYITVTVTVLAKSSPNLSAEAVTAKYGETGKSVSATRDGSGDISYAVKSGLADYIDVDASTGALTLKKVGTAYVTVSVAATDNHAADSTDVTITINKADLTVKAKNQSIYVGGTAPDLTAPVVNTHYTVTGLVGEDSLGTVTMQYQKDGLEATPDVATTGSYDIVISSAVDTAKYNVSYTSGTLTISNRSYGGGGGSASYAISVDKAQNGSITVSPKSASKGDTVTITVAPDKGYTLETLTVLDKNGKEITVTAKDGKYTFTMPASKVTVKGTFAEDNSMLNFFTDVPADAYYYDAVKWAVENGITNGINATEFGPDLSCTRGQIVTFLWRAAGCPEPKSMSSFSDVPADAFYAKAVAWAVENGITGGIGGNKFAPDETCTRAQSATFLYRAAGSPAVSGSAEFSDVGTDTFYANAVAWAAKEGITGGIGGGLFGSELDCTRGQIVTFLYRSIVK